MTVRKVRMYNHWQSMCGEIDPENNLGFVYLIYCKTTKRFYIGKKNFMFISKKTVAGQKRKRIVTKESDWMDYKSSSKYVQEDIAKYGTKDFEFFIIQCYKTKSGLTYAEAYLQHVFLVMNKMLDSKIRLFYNAQIAAIRFVVKEFYPEAEKIITKLMKQRM